MLLELETPHGLGLRAQLIEVPIVVVEIGIDLVLILAVAIVFSVGIESVELIRLILQLLLEIVDALLVAAFVAWSWSGRARLHPPARAFGLQ